MKIINKVKNIDTWKIIVLGTAVFFVMVLIVVMVQGIGDTESEAVASSGNVSAGEISIAAKENKSGKKADKNKEGETTTIQEILQLTATVDGEMNTQTEEVTTEKTVEQEISQPLSNNETQSSTTSKPMQIPTQSTMQPSQIPTQPITQSTTSAPTEGLTQFQNVWLNYEGYREDEIEVFKQKLIALRQSEIPKYGYSEETKQKYITPQWNDTLYRIAKERAKEIAMNFSHESAGDYCSGYKIIECITSNPNYDVGYAVSAYNNWYNSPEHRNGLITGGDQYAVAFYQKQAKVYAAFVGGDSNNYYAENYAKFYSEDWQEDGYISMQQAYNSYYNLFVNAYGIPVIK